MMYDSFEEQKVEERKRLFCNECGHRTIHNVKSRFAGRWDDEASGINGGTDFSIYQCGGCDAVCYLTSSWDSENLDYDHDGTMYAVTSDQQYPPPLEKGFTFDQSHTAVDLDKLLNELTSSFLQGNYVSSTFLIRVIIEYIAKDAKATGKSLYLKINSMEKSGLVDTEQRDLLHAIRKKGNAGAHDGLAMSSDALRGAMGVIAVLVDKIYNTPGKTRDAIKTAKKALST